MIVLAALSALSLLTADTWQDPPAPDSDLPPPEEAQPPLDAPTPTPEQDHPAAKAYFDCLVAAVRQYDDGHSDAATIALGIESNCAGPFDDFKQESTEGLSAEARAMALEKIDRSEEQYAIKAVLTVRARHAHASPPAIR